MDQSIGCSITGLALTLNRNQISHLLIALAIVCECVAVKSSLAICSVSMRSSVYIFFFISVHRHTQSYKHGVCESHSLARPVHKIYLCAQNYQRTQKIASLPCMLFNSHACWYFFFLQKLLAAVWVTTSLTRCPST